MALIWFDKLADMVAKGAPNPTFNVFPAYQGPFPWVKDAMTPDGKPGPREEIELVSARVFKAVAGGDVYAVLVLCRLQDDGTPAWTIYCGDKQVAGDFKSDGKVLASQLRKAGVVSNKVCNALEAQGWSGQIVEQNNCGFFKVLERTKGAKYCAHTQVVLASTPEAEFAAMADEVKAWRTGDDGGVSAAVGKLSPEEAAFYDAAFIQHVMLAGERGSGKTYLARAAADKYDAVYLEVQMHPSMEAWELRAHDRAWNGKVYTVLGKFAEAVYWIQQGKKVVLCMDEFLNMNPIYTTVVNSPLSLTERDTYLIETGRIIDMGDGIGKPEVVEVPSEMLWVVATTNIGARYNLDKIPPSVRARFLIILMNTNPERTKTIVESTLNKYDMPIDFAEKFEKFITTINQAVLENTLDEEATTRLACNVVRAVAKKAARDKKVYKGYKQWLPAIKAQLLTEIAQIVNFENGLLDVEQKLMFETTVDASFK